MPQGRHKIPFSGKAKKAQMLMKRERKEEGSEKNVNRREAEEEARSTKPVVPVDKGAVLTDVQLHGKAAAHKYDLIFKQESRLDVAASRERARQPLKRITSEKDMEVESEDLYPSSTDFPRRPPWDSTMAKAAFEANEARYFRSYVSDLFETHEKVEGKNLSYFELNLETWRQLWRVIEMSDILLVIVDIRCPAFPPSLYNYVNEHSHQKHMVLILNKVDLIPAGLALAWKDYFEKKFSNLSVAFFSSCPAYNLRVSLSTKTGLKFRKLRGRISMVAEGAKSIFEECQRIAKQAPNLSDIDLESWRLKIENAVAGGYPTEDISPEEIATLNEQRVLTIGTVGHPNVGKSSLINSLMGKRVVSVSKTPGHTKHFQTIFLSKSVKLCDCPGLVFPSLMPKPLQVLQGSYPISQVREPLSIVQYLAERVDIPHMLGLTHPENDRCKWSAFDVCEAWAIKRGYTTARTNRPDVYRSANHIMRMTLEGKITLAFLPPDYDKDVWENHPNLVQINELLGLSEAGGHENNGDELDELSEDEDEVVGEAGGGGQDEEGADDDKVPKFSSLSKNKFTLLMMDEDD